MSSRVDSLYIAEKMRRRMNITRIEIRRKISEIRTGVVGGVVSLKENGMRSLKHVKEELTIKHQVEQRPWTVLAVSIGAGFLVAQKLASQSVARSSQMADHGHLSTPMAAVKSLVGRELVNASSILIEFSLRRLLGLMAQKQNQLKAAWEKEATANDLEITPARLIFEKNQP